MNAANIAPAPTAEAHFILVTTDGCLGSYTDSLVDGKRVVKPMRWHTETEMPTDSVHLILTLDAGNVIKDLTISGDDWRLLESEGLIEEFVGRLFAGDNGSDVQAEMVARGNANRWHAVLLGIIDQ